MLTSFAPGFVFNVRPAHVLIQIRIDRPPQVVDVQPHNQIRIPNQSAATLPEGMTRWECSTRHRRLKSLGEFNQAAACLPLSVRSAPVCTGFSAATRSAASSATAPESAAGGLANVSFGMCNGPWLVMPVSWRWLSATSTTGPIGGVMDILYARTADSAKCVSESGRSSHFV